MPKKPARNAFYFYMLEFKEEARKKGRNYGSLKDVAEAASPSWKALPKSAVAHYDELAKEEKRRCNIPEMKYTSLGESYADVHNRQMQQKEMEDKEIRDITLMLKFKKIDRTLLDEDLFIMDVNYYCHTASNEYVICECSLLSFNIRDGLKEQFHELIHPGPIPTGYTSDAKLASIDMAISLPDEDQPPTDTNKTLSRIVSHLKKHDKDGSIAPIFTLPDKVAPVVNFIQLMCSRVSTDDSVYRIYKLDRLFFHLINTVKSNPEDGFPSETLALAQLNKDPFQFHQGLACEHHEQTERAMTCTLSRVKRWAFTILDHCCQLAGVEMVAGQHVPADVDVQAVAEFKEKRKTKSSHNILVRSDQKPFDATGPPVDVLRKPKVRVYNQIGPVTEDSSRKSTSRGRSSRVGGPSHMPDSLPGTGRGRAVAPPFDLSEQQFPSLRGGRGPR